MGEDQAENGDEESPVVDALLHSGLKHGSRKQESKLPKGPAPLSKTRQKHVQQEPAPSPGSRQVSVKRPPPSFKPSLYRDPARSVIPEHLGKPASPLAPPPVQKHGNASLEKVETDLKDGLVAQVENIVARQISGPVRQKLISEITTSLESGAIQEVIKRFKRYFTAQVKEIVKAEVKADLKVELSKELRAEFQKEFIDARQLASRLSGSHDNLRKNIATDVAGAVLTELRAEFAGTLNQARDVSKMIAGDIEPIKKLVKAELKHDIEQKIRQDLPAMFRTDLKDEIVREIHDEIGNTLKRALVTELGDEVRQDVKEHLGSYIKQKARMACINASSDLAPVHLVFIDFNNLWVIADRFTVNIPKFKRVLELLQSILHEYDDQFVPGRLSGFIFFSRYHEQNASRYMSTPSFDDAELDMMRQQFITEEEGDKKMLQNGQERTYRDIDVLLATKAAELISREKNRVASITIVGGDGDFNPLIDIARKHGIYSIVLAFKQGLSTSLKHHADECHYLNKPSKTDP